MRTGPAETPILPSSKSATQEAQGTALESLLTVFFQSFTYLKVSPTKTKRLVWVMTTLHCFDKVHSFGAEKEQIGAKFPYKTYA